MPYGDYLLGFTLSHLLVRKFLFCQAQLIDLSFYFENFCQNFLNYLSLPVTGGSSKRAFFIPKTRHEYEQDS